MQRVIAKNFEHNGRCFVVFAEFKDGASDWTLRVQCSIDSSKLTPLRILNDKKYATADEAIIAGELIARQHFDFGEN